jgi:hypothetical protein
VALPLMGLTMGMSTALGGVILPVAYGTRHLGSVRSLVTTIGVLATAIGPGVTGILIDRGIDFPRQCLALGLWCLALGAAGLAINRRFAAEAAAGNN